MNDDHTQQRTQSPSNRVGIDVDNWAEIHERLARLESEDEAIRDKLENIDGKLDGITESIEQNEEVVDDHQFMYRAMQLIGVVLLGLNGGLAVYIVQLLA